jgi:RimJ/RimL family protein N-acetyltransferase
MTDFLKSKGVEKVYATVEPENEPSLRAMERMGFSITTLDENYYGLGHGRYVVTKELNN